jgi:hypothetical protein
MSSHRGAHPDDDALFAPAERPRLRAAVRDLSWLRSRGYGDNGSLKLVGDRYRLHRRQRNAVARSACSDTARARRLLGRRPLDAVRVLHVDGFNVLITLEGALGGAYLFRGRDGAYRDVAPVQGTFRLVEETGPALRAVHTAVRAAGLRRVVWWLDAHVSNVGRLVEQLRAAAGASLDWAVRVRDDVDAVLRDTSAPIATSDSALLDEARHWCVLEPAVLARTGTAANVCDLRPDGPGR